MLLRFIVENLFCFAEEAIFSMVATKDTSHPEHFRQENTINTLRIAALYGANAHGKSKFVEAMKLAQSIVIGGIKPQQQIPVKPFLLSTHFNNKPSRFEFSFTIQGVVHTYGFVCDKNRFHEEWLYSRPKQREVTLFERVTDASGTSQFTIGRTLARTDSESRHFIKFLQKHLQSDQLFLTRAAENNLIGLVPVYTWFKNNLRVWSPDDFLGPIPLLVRTSSNFREFTGRFLKTADTGIDGIEVVEKGSIPMEQLAKLPEPFREELMSSDEESFIITNNNEGLLKFSKNIDPTHSELVTHHIAADGNVVHFSLNNESAGTRRLLQLLPILHTTDDEENVFVIDELDRTLHPCLSRLFVETFLKANSCNKNQLVFTTHENTLMDLELLRRDEIWFVEKDAGGKSHLYPLSSLKIRPDLNTERGYLHGRFGAIPFIGDTKALGW